jgi:hypothetical protein
MRKEYKDRCLCPNCPTFVDCKAKLFCLTEKSKCIKEKKGCLCMGCPVHLELKLKYGYYCISGSEKERNEE